VLYFDTASSLKAVTTTCTFKASDGKAEVPAEAFADFPASSGTWQAYSLQLGEATPAGWGVRFTMSSGAIDPAGASVQGAVDYK
jgi:hypothetical protein